LSYSFKKDSGGFLFPAEMNEMNEPGTGFSGRPVYLYTGLKNQSSQEAVRKPGPAINR
jgi:hypothetical protein